MLVVAYKINEVLVGNYERNGDACSQAIIIGSTLFLTGISLGWLGMQYYWYHGCGYNNIIISITILAGIAFFVIVFLRTREDASILTSSIVLLYVSYLQWSALAANPNQTCNPFGDSSVNTVMQIVLGLFFTFISLIVISGSTKKSDENNLTTRANNHMMEDEEDDGTRLDDVEKKNGKNLD